MPEKVAYKDVDWEAVVRGGLRIVPDLCIQLGGVLYQHPEIGGLYEIPDREAAYGRLKLWYRHGPNKGNRRVGRAPNGGSCLDNLNEDELVTLGKIVGKLSESFPHFEIDLSRQESELGVMVYKVRPRELPRKIKPQ